VLLVSSIVARGAGQAFLHQLVVKRLEGRMLDDGQHVDQAARLLARR
jgi:hypothetical protein